MRIIVEDRSNNNNDDGSRLVGVSFHIARILVVASRRVGAKGSVGGILDGDVISIVELPRAHSTAPVFIPRPRRVRSPIEI